MALILDKTEQKIVDIIDAHRNEIIEFAKDIYMQSWVIKNTELQKNLLLS